jgi:molybdopterin/thiamine biosynthesis adenylyltransferase/rhodanese-related sulfurtransferase
MLTPGELARYQRQVTLPEVGLLGQEKLRRARVLIVGAGGLGSPAALYLAAAGVGTLGIIDDDEVEVSNLHRQILHSTTDIGRPKAASASDSIGRLNPHVKVLAHSERLTHPIAEQLLGEYDLIVDGSDNYTTRYVVNDACARAGKIWIYGSVERFSGQVSVFGAPGGPCYRCIFPEPPAPGATANCEEIGVIGAVPGVVGALQAIEALKCLLDSGGLLIGRLLQLDFQRATSHTIHFERRLDCPACGDTSGEQHAGSGNGTELTDIEPGELAGRLSAADFQLIDIREPWEWAIAQIGSSQRIPMNELPASLERFDKSRELIVYCHHGVRSDMAAEWLRAQGFRARNLAGGIDRWSREIDPAVRRY